MNTTSFKYYLLFLLTCITISMFGQNNNLIVDGRLGIGTDDPQTTLHVRGDISTPWGVTWYQYQSNFAVDNRFRPWLRRAWSSATGDFTYFGVVGNRENTILPALFLSEQNGFLVGKGSNEGSGLSEEHFQVDDEGKIIISDLAGKGSRTVKANNDGRLFLQEIPGGYTDVISIPHTSFVSVIDPEFGEFNEGKSYAYHQRPTITNIEWLNASVHLPHNSRIRKIESYLYDNSANSSVVVGIFRYDSGLDIGRFSNTADWLKVNSTTGAVDGIQALSQDLDYFIDNINYSYVIQVRGGDVNGISTEDWPTNDIGVQKIVIYYD